MRKFPYSNFISYVSSNSCDVPGIRVAWLKTSVIYRNFAPELLESALKTFGKRI